MKAFDKNIKFATERILTIDNERSGRRTRIIKLQNKTVVQILPDNNAPFRIIPCLNFIPPAISWKISLMRNNIRTSHKIGCFVVRQTMRVNCVALSAKGSRIFPNVVIISKRLAIFPSIRSVMQDTVRIDAAKK